MHISFLILAFLFAVPYIRTQLQGMGLESHIGSMRFWWGVYKALGSSITIASFCNVIFPRFLSIGIRAFHYVSQLQSSDAGGDAGIAVFALD